MKTLYEVTPAELIPGHIYYTSMYAEGATTKLKFISADSRNSILYFKQVSSSKILYRTNSNGYIPFSTQTFYSKVKPVSTCSNVVAANGYEF